MPPDTQAKQQIAERLKTANNVLVTVSNNPSVDQLASAIGFTLLLNKLGKHATAVFSGAVPSTLEFLQPEATLEKNTDSLRDFIIALDKSKADKLRYKVEDKVVKIFITPYRTSLSEKDLDFSQGDFNVEVVLALGVHEQKELDAAIVAHGRILHDATVVSINNHDAGNLGTINWNEPQASSLCELLVSLGEVLGPNLFDAQMATAFLTGIVAETNRFSNDKTSPRTMTIAAHLMSLGANQQLIATKLEKPAPPPPPKADSGTTAEDEFDSGKLDEIAKEEPAKNSDGALKIDHDAKSKEEPKKTSKPVDTSSAPPPPAGPENGGAGDQIDIDTQGTLHRLDLEAEKAAKATREEKTKSHDGAGRLILQPPTLGGKLTANSEPEGLDPSTDPMSLPAVSQPLLSRDGGQGESPSSQEAKTPVSSDGPVPDPSQARDAVNDALQSSPSSQPLEPIAALNAQPLDLNRNSQDYLAPTTPDKGQNVAPGLMTPPAPTTPPTNANLLPTPPPPVPPPMMPPPFGQPPSDEDVPPTEPLAAL